MRSKEALNQLLFYRYFVVKDKNVLWVISNKIAFFYSFIMYPIVIISSNFLIVITMDIWKRYYIAWCKQCHIFFQISIHDTCFPCWSNLLRILFFSLYLFSSNSDNDILRFFLVFFHMLKYPKINLIKKINWRIFYISRIYKVCIVISLASNSVKLISGRIKHLFLFNLCILSETCSWPLCVKRLFQSASNVWRLFMLNGSMQYMIL